MPIHMLPPSFFCFFQLVVLGGAAFFLFVCVILFADDTAPMAEPVPAVFEVPTDALGLISFADNAAPMAAPVPAVFKVLMGSRVQYPLPMMRPPQLHDLFLLYLKFWRLVWILWHPSPMTQLPWLPRLHLLLLYSKFRWMFQIPNILCR